MKKLFTLLFLFTTLNILAAERVEELEQFEIRSYSPVIVGVKDLVYEVRVDGMKELLEKNLVIGKISDLYFKVYWLSNGENRIEVEGLPKGFKEVRDDLRQLIKGKLDFVMPEKFSQKLKPYTLKIENIPDGKLLRAIDETYTLAVPEIDVTFDKTNRMKLIETKMASSAVTTEFFHSAKSWSNNKLVLDRVVSNSGVPGAKMTIINDIEYGNFNGVGFPAKLTVKNISEFTVATKEKDKTKIEKKETTTVIKFSKFEVNTGKAQRFIQEGLLK